MKMILNISHKGIILEKKTTKSHYFSGVKEENEDQKQVDSQLCLLCDLSKRLN